MHYFAHDEPRPAPFNADELTAEHAKELGGYLNEVARHLSDKHPEGSVLHHYRDRGARGHVGPVSSLPWSGARGVVDSVLRVRVPRVPALTCND